MLTRGASQNLGSRESLQALHGTMAGYCCLSSSLAWENNDLARRRENCILNSRARVRATGRRREAIISTRSQTCLRTGACRWGTETPHMSRQVDWQARITHVQGEICRCQILIVTFEKLRAVGWDATRRDEGSFLVSAEYAHPWLF